MVENDHKLYHYSETSPGKRNIPTLTFIPTVCHLPSQLVRAVGLVAPQEKRRSRLTYY